MLQYRGLLGIGLHRLPYCFSTHDIMQLSTTLWGKRLIVIQFMYRYLWSVWLYWPRSTGCLHHMLQYFSGGVGYCFSTISKLCSSSPTSWDDGNDDCHPKRSFCIIGMCAVHLAIAATLNWVPWSHTALDFWLVGIFLYSDKCPIMQQSVVVPSCYGEGYLSPKWAI